MAIKNEKFFQEAEKIFYSQENEKLLEFLIPCKDEYQNLDSVSVKKYNRLLAYGYAYQNKLSEAESHCIESLKIDSYPIDHYFVLTYVHLTLREYKKAIQYANLYLTLFDELKSSENYYSFDKNYCSQIYNFMGNSFQELGEFEDAVVAYTKSISIVNENHHPYLHLVNLYINLKKYEKAQIIIQLGLKSCSQIQELRLLEKSIKSEKNNQIDEKSSPIEDYTLVSLMADSCKKEGDYDSAIQQYESLLHVEPNNIELLYKLSECYLLMGHRDSAIVGFSRILELNPNFQPAQEQ